VCVHASEGCGSWEGRAKNNIMEIRKGRKKFNRSEKTAKNDKKKRRKVFLSSFSICGGEERRCMAMAE
jgi:hypothetical protein